MLLHSQHLAEHVVSRTGVEALLSRCCVAGRTFCPPKEDCCIAEYDALTLSSLVQHAGRAFVKRTKIQKAELRHFKPTHVQATLGRHGRTRLELICAFDKIWAQSTHGILGCCCFCASLL